MVLELKIESLRARGELTTPERDRLLQALVTQPVPARMPRKRMLTPLRIFLAGMLCGVGLAYLVWFCL